MSSISHERLLSNIFWNVNVSQSCEESVLNNFKNYFKDFIQTVSTKGIAIEASQKMLKTKLMFPLNYVNFKYKWSSLVGKGGVHLQTAPPLVTPLVDGYSYDNCMLSIESVSRNVTFACNVHENKNKKFELKKINEWSGLCHLSSLWLPVFVSHSIYIRYSTHPIKTFIVIIWNFEAIKYVLFYTTANLVDAFFLLLGISFYVEYSICHIANRT